MNQLLLPNTNEIKDKPHTAAGMYYVAVYGTLKSGYHNHTALMGNSLYVREIHVPAMMISFPHFPGIILHKDIPALHPAANFVTSKITYAQVYLVDRKILADLDLLEGVPDHYMRDELSCDGIGKYFIYKLAWSKYIKGHQIVVPGGTWLGKNTTVNEIDFGEGDKLPRVIGWFNKDRLKSTQQAYKTSRYDDEFDDELPPFDTDEGATFVEPTETPVQVVMDSKEA